MVLNSQIDKIIFCNFFLKKIKVIFEPALEKLLGEVLTNLI